MSNSGASTRVKSNGVSDDTSRDTSCFSLFKTDQGYPLTRKVIDPSGRLGSLYNASNDNLIDQHSVQTFSQKVPSKRFVCQIFSGVQSRELISVLENIGFDIAVRQSIHHQMVVPLGISRFIEYDQPISQTTRFLYYSYKARKEKLLVEARNADRIVAPPLGPTEATHMITKLVWGVEILCVIQIQKNQPINEIDRLLHRIHNQLKNNAIPIDFNNNEQRLINQLTNTTVFGSETCVDDPNISLLTILREIPNWQRNMNFHQPLIYTMQPLRWLYNSERFQKSCAGPDQVNTHIDRIQPLLERIENQMRNIGEMFQKFPTKFSSPILNERLIDFHQQYRVLLDTQEDLQVRLRKVIPDVRLKQTKPISLDNIIADQRYQCLREGELERFRMNVERLLTKAVLIEKLKNDRIEYINAFEIRSNGRIPTTNEDIDVLLRRCFSKENGPVILWYSSDRLKREQADRWEQAYQQLMSERQQTTQPIKLVYADFTQCPERLQDFTIIKLSGTRHDPITEIVPQSSRTKSAPTSPKRLSLSLMSPIIQTDSASVTSKASSSRPGRTPSPLPTPSSKRLPESSTRPDRTLSPSPPPLSKRPRRPLTPPLIPSTIPDKQRVLPPPPILRAPVTEINVLLLGETGVGKSTFINAFVNYLKFETLEQGERGDPAVLIPVSFLITIGDQFDEFIVKFGNVDPNENHENQGQSVTQQCKSYVFDINDRLRLRLIDTPGIGDTRGVDQDVKNIDHILTYVNNLSHLNAVCLLLKPNASRLNVFFRSCVSQLLTYLTPTAFNNIIFCFTNARTTFYAPGDTGRLLREMLEQERLTDIPFKKENTFCFDSESFRYLAARKCNIDFDDYQKVECKNSWNVSVAESIRLLKFIQTREPYYLEAWQSPRKIALDISMFARPIMETLRLIIYNWKLSESKLVFNQMVLNSNPVDTEMCTHCAQTNIVETGPLWITQYQPPLLKTNSNQHRLCSLDGKHFLVEAILQHEFIALPAGLKTERWKNSFLSFLRQCDRLLHFLRQQGSPRQDDPFEPILERFLEEEQQISQIRNINTDMNRKVLQSLHSIKQIRQQNSQQLFESNEILSLQAVYQVIDELIDVPTVQKQIDSIKRTRQFNMKRHEQKLPANLIKNKTFI